MNPKSITLRGLPAHPATTLDLDALPDGLIAIVGPNGSGKTTLLEALGPTAIFGRSPFYTCDFGDLVGPDGGSITLVGEHDGQEWTITRTIAKRRHDARLSIDGVEIETMGRVGDFDAEVGKRFMPRALYLASIYAAQAGEGSFIGLPEAGQRDLFAKLLGIEELQERAVEAAGIANAAADAVAETDRKIAATTAQVTRLAELRQSEPALLDAVAVARGVAQQAADAVFSARDAHDRLQHTLSRLERDLDSEQEGEREHLLVAHAAEVSTANIGARLTAARDAEEYAARLEQQLAEGERRAARLAEAQAALTTARLAEANALRDVETLDREIDVRHRQLLQLEVLQQKRGDIAGLEAARVAITERLREAAAVVDERRAQTSAADQALTRATRDLTEHDHANALELAQTRSALKLAEEAAALLGSVPCGGRVLRNVTSDGNICGIPAQTTTVVDCGTCPLLGNAKTSAGLLDELKAREAALVAPALRDALVAKANEARALRDASSTSLAEAQETHRALCVEYDANAARRDAIREHIPEDLDLQVAAAGFTLEAARMRHAGLVAVHTERKQETQHAAVLEAFQEPGPGDLAALRAELAQLRELVDSLPELITEQAVQASRRLSAATMAQGYATRAQALRLQIEQTCGIDAATGRQLGPQDVVAESDAALRAATTAAAAAEANLVAAQDALAGLRGRLEELGGATTRLDALNASRGRLDVIRARHDLLASSLGRKGLQAHEIDGAGPMVSGLVNDLLAACYGTRFTMELVTKQEAGGRKKEKEVFDLQFWDEKTGTKRSFDRLSGGERVIINEALKLALALLTSRRSGIRCGALFRDEVDGALDDSNADRYPLLLRRAAEIGGFRRVYFISHRSEVYGQADGRIILGGDSPRLEVQ
jgi:exonuclease SbcC